MVNFYSLLVILLNTLNYVTCSANFIGVDISSNRMAIYHGPDEDCEITTNKTLFLDEKSHGGLFIPNYEVMKMSRTSFDQLLKLCEKIHIRLFNNDKQRYTNPRTFESISRFGKSGMSSIWKLNPLNSLMIFPGTKWCGVGSIANHYNDLGYHVEADWCCRKHDLCLEMTGEYLSPGHCKNGLCNNSPYTRSPCTCDKAFLKCLKQAKTRVANALGRVFFNIAGLTCYKYDYPIKRCVETVDISRSTRVPVWLLRALHVSPDPKQVRCKRYELDLTKPKVWQFFETFYDETAGHFLEEPRAPRLLGFPSSKPRHGQKISQFQKFLVDIFVSVVDPYHNSRATR